MKIRFVSNARGFLKDLLSTNYKNLTFVYNEGKIYEANGKLKAEIAKLVKKPIFDCLGIFQVLTVDVTEDCVLSYNRFLHTNKPYVMYLENPLAPMHYSVDRSKSCISRMRLKRVFKNGNLKAIVALSKACESTIKEFYDVPESIKILNIYPYIKERRVISSELIEKKANNRELKLLYISSDFELKGGQDILKVFEKLDDNIKLTIVTKIETISKKDRMFIEKKTDAITLYDFVLSKDELAELYIESNILLNPTRQDSFSLVTLEAMKYGNAILSTDMYALKEMVQDGQQGYLTKARYDIWTEKNLPNKPIWNHRRKTIYSSFIDDRVVDFLHKKIVELNNDRELLNNLEQSAYNKVTTGEFSEQYILEQWNTLFGEIMEG